MPTLEQRVQRLEDERSILQALYAYGHGLDYGLEEAFLDAFAEDGVLHWPSKPGIEGQAALRAAFRNHTHAPAAYHKHFLVEPRIEVDGDRATVQSMFARLDRYGGVPNLRSYGRYLDIMIRCKDGRWRIKERRCEREAARTDAPDGGKPSV